MKKIITAFAISICALVMLTGCPYETKVALGKSDACTIDSALLGEWMGADTCTTGEHPDSIYMNIFAFNGTEYYIRFGEKANGVIKDKDNLRAFETKIGKVRFMNVIGLGEKSWLICRFAVADDRLKVSYLTDKLIKQKFSTSEELNQFVTKYISDKNLTEGDLTFIRQKK